MVLAIHKEHIHAFVAHMPHGIWLAIENKSVVAFFHHIFELVLLITSVWDLEYCVLPLMIFEKSGDDKGIPNVVHCQLCPKWPVASLQIIAC